MHRVLLRLSVCSMLAAFGSSVSAQMRAVQSPQPQAAPPAAQAPPQQVQAAPQPPPQFQLNKLEQTFLDQVLDKWQFESGKINTFRCPFERWEYNAAFGPGGNIPLNKDKGDLSYQKPDKGSFEITEINTWQAKPLPPGQAPPAQAQGDWIKQENAIGEHWVCDGASIYEYRTEQKQLVERAIPKEMQGKAIADGPLPFLFGADAAKLKQRYWMRIEQQPNNSEIWLASMPKFPGDAANYRGVRIILDQAQFLPKAMEVELPNGDRHAYIFDLANVSVNGNLDRLKDLLFERPMTPLGWKRVVEDVPAAGQPGAPPPRQAEQPSGATAR
jgi:TIGR03009 family protein